MADGFVFAEHRYYHAVIVGPNPPWGLERMWRTLGVESGRLADESHGGVDVQHRVWRHTEAFGPAADESKAADFQRSGAYLYDLVGLRCSVDAGRFVVLAAPYGRVAAQLLWTLRDGGLLRKAEFARASLATIVDRVRKGTSELTRLSIRNAAMRLDDSPDLDGVSISGDRPIFTPLYDHLLGGAGDKLIFIRLIVSWLGETGGTLSVHLDRFGNYKIWVQAQCKNVHLMGEVVNAISSVGALVASSEFPVVRGRSAELDETIATE